MRKALVVGVNYYSNFSHLHGCGNDAKSVAPLLQRNFDQTKNFDVELVVADDLSSSLGKKDLRDKIKELFQGESEVSLLYFAGHGHIESTGGYIHASESNDDSDGIPLSEIIQWASESSAKNKVIILDSCHSGSASALPFNSEVSAIPDGTTILNAARMIGGDIVPPAMCYYTKLKTS